MLVGMLAGFAATGDVAACYVDIEARSPADAVATAESVEREITVPLERALLDLPGVLEIRSSTSEGSSRIELRCSGIEPAALAQAVRERLARIQLGLPLRAGDPQVMLLDQARLMGSSAPRATK